MYSIKIYVQKMTILDVRCEKMFQTSVYNDQDYMLPNTTTYNISKPLYHI